MRAVLCAGRLLTCALQNLARIKAFQPKAGVVMAPHTLASCVVLLERLVIVVFPDFGYVAHFLEHCKPAIERFHCGQPLLPPSAEAPADTLGTLHSQAKTVDCLMMQVRRLEPECRTQVVRLGEVQANDWARDRSFFYACQHDREALCPGVVAGARLPPFLFPFVLDFLSYAPLSCIWRVEPNFATRNVLAGAEHVFHKTNSFLEVISTCTMLLYSYNRPLAALRGIISNNN